jgi:hypothetical protein
MKHINKINILILIEKINKKISKRFILMEEKKIEII